MNRDEESPAANPYGEESAVGIMNLSRASKILQQVRPWVLFLGVLAMVTAVLLAMGTITISLAMLFDAEFPLPFPGWMLAIVYVAGAAVYFLPALYLLKFSRRIVRSCICHCIPADVRVAEYG